jgi:hypothetical protein
MGKCGYVRWGSRSALLAHESQFSDGLGVGLVFVTHLTGMAFFKPNGKAVTTGLLTTLTWLHRIELKCLGLKVKA